MKRLSGYPNWFYGLLLFAGASAVISGVLMIPDVMEFKLQWEVDWRLSGGQRLATAALHVVFGWLLLMLLGALWHAHLRAGWRKRLNHFSGIAIALGLCGLALTGIGLYYLGSERGQLLSSIIHSTLGILLPVLSGWHIWHGRRIRAATNTGHESQKTRVTDGLAAQFHV